MNTASAQRTLFDENWRFYRGAALGAEDVKFNDDNWRTLNLPHDWSIEDLPGTTSPFNPGALTQVSGGFTTGGTGWYRKHFHADTTKRTIILFDGVYMNAEVWINGKKLGKHPYGYTSFWYDISSYQKEENVIAVKVRNEGENSRWYSGSGIYRHVWLYSLDATHIDPWGVSITTPDINTVRIQTKLQTGFKQITMRIRILDANNKEVAVRECPATANSTQDITIQKPVLWSVDNPSLYKAIITVFANGKATDTVTTTFGIRTIAFDAENGFRLNGQPLKLKGGCVHHDNGPLGAKAYDRAEERKVELLKASGYNAVRCAHNPPSPAFLDACDRLGMLVIDEAFDTWLGYMQKQSFYPWNLAYCGDIDICGWKRPQSYYRDALWLTNQLSIFVQPPQPSFKTNPDKVDWSRWEWNDVTDSWNWKGYENTPLKVVVYTSDTQAELFLNGRSLGKKTAENHIATWDVLYVEGTLKAVSKKNTAVLTTAAEPVKIVLAPDKTEIDDLCYITVNLTDANGIRNPLAEDLVYFTIDGPGTILGVGNANPQSLESFQLPQRKAWQGRCLVIVKANAPGKITLTAKTSKLPAASTTIKAL